MKLDTAIKLYVPTTRVKKFRTIEACPSAFDGDTIQKQLDDMMEQRSFYKEKSGNGWVIYSRGKGDNRWCKIFFTGTGRDGIGKVICHTNEKTYTKQGWDGAYGFAQAHGD